MWLACFVAGVHCLCSAVSIKTPIFSPEKIFIVAWVYSSPRVTYCNCLCWISRVFHQVSLSGVLPFNIWTVMMSLLSSSNVLRVHSILHFTLQIFNRALKNTTPKPPPNPVSQTIFWASYFTSLAVKIWFIGDFVEGLAKSEYATSSSFLHKTSCFITESCQVCHTLFHFA